MSSKLIIALIALVLIGTGVYFATKNRMNTEVPVPTPTTEEEIPTQVPATGEPFEGREVQTFSDERLGVTFKYPSGENGYTLVDTSEQASNGQSMKFVSLYNTKEWEEYQNSTEGREGPRGISMMVVSANDVVSPKEWVETNSLSNYQLEGAGIGDETLDGIQAYRYRYDGLYGSTAVAALKGPNAYVFSVTYIDPSTDQIVKDFEQILKTVTFAR